MVKLPLLTDRNGNKGNNKNKFGNKSGPVASPGGITYSLSLKAPVPVIFLDEENTNGKHVTNVATASKSNSNNSK